MFGKRWDTTQKKKQHLPQINTKIKKKIILKLLKKMMMVIMMKEKKVLMMVIKITQKIRNISEMIATNMVTKKSLMKI